MCKRFIEWEQEIKDFCVKNHYNFEKAKKLPMASNDEILVLQYYDPDNESVKKGLGLLDETPMPVVLWIEKTGDHLEFKQTEHTQKYLS